MKHKQFVYSLAFTWSIFAMLYISGITFLGIPESGVRFADTALGFILGTVVGTIINYFYGDSDSTYKKGEDNEAN
jgi:hypothetical protein